MFNNGVVIENCFVIFSKYFCKCFFLINEFFFILCCIDDFILYEILLIVFICFWVILVFIGVFNIFMICIDFLNILWIKLWLFLFLWIGLIGVCINVVILDIIVINKYLCYIFCVIFLFKIKLDFVFVNVLEICFIFFEF